MPVKTEGEIEEIVARFDFEFQEALKHVKYSRLISKIKVHLIDLMMEPDFIYYPPERLRRFLARINLELNTTIAPLPLDDTAPPPGTIPQTWSSFAAPLLHLIEIGQSYIYSNEQPAETLPPLSSPKNL